MPPKGQRADPKELRTRELNLTSRERQVLALIAHGKTSKEIADCMSLSVETVGNHRKSLCRKLAVHSTAELVLRAVVGATANSLNLGSGEQPFLRFGQLGPAKTVE